MTRAGIVRMDVPADEAWRRLSDLEQIGRALPAVDLVDVESPDRLVAAFGPTTGLGVTPLRMVFEVADRDERQRLRVQATGRGPDCAVRLEAAFELVPVGGATDVRWSLDVHVHGLLRSLTQRVLPDLVDRQVAAVLAAVP
jgi:carbon monoxide dehydrogenase subunit G